MKTILSLVFCTNALFAADFSAPVLFDDSSTGGPLLYATMRYQQVSGADRFSSLTPVGGGWITALQFRQEGGSFIPGFTSGYPLTFRRYLARENIVRHFQGNTDPNRVDGVSTNNCEKGIVQHNLIALNSRSEPNWRLTNTINGQLAFIDNQRAAGIPVRPFNNIVPPSGVFTDDLCRDAIEDATTLGFL